MQTVGIFRVTSSDEKVREVEHHMALGMYVSIAMALGTYVSIAMDCGTYVSIDMACATYIFIAMSHWDET